MTATVRAGTARRAVAERLAEAGCVSPEAEARWLLEEAVAGDAGQLAAPPPGRELTAAEQERLELMTRRRTAGEPLQYVVGWAPFGWLRVRVGPGVFIPRPETERLAELAAERLRAGGSPAVAVDLCTGSAAIACFLAHAVEDCEVYATEADPRAAAWARRNARGRRVRVLLGDLDAPLPAVLRERVRVITANVPYVPTGELRTLPRDVRGHEPLLALDGGTDGLDVLRRAVLAAPGWLAPGGWLLCEVGDGQAAAARALLCRAGLDSVAVHRDLVGRERVVEGRRPPQ